MIKLYDHEVNVIPQLYENLPLTTSRKTKTAIVSAHTRIDEVRVTRNESYILGAVPGTYLEQHLGRR